MSKDARRSLEQLLASAKTAEDLDAIETLASALADLQARTGSYTVETMRDVAAFFGVAEQTVRAWNMRPGGIPGESGAWPLDAIAKWYVTWRTESATSSEPKPRDMIKDKLAALDLAEREKRLVDVSEVSTWLDRVAGVLRDAITALENRYGSEAADILRTPLERLEQEVSQHAPR